jgi:hypothetical protein
MVFSVFWFVAQFRHNRREHVTGNEISVRLEPCQISAKDATCQNWKNTPLTPHFLIGILKRALENL